MSEDVNKTENGDLRRWRTISFVVGAVALILCAVGFFIEPVQFFRSYLLAFIFWLCLSLGSLGVLMLGFVTGGRWSVILRRPLFSAVKTLPLMALFFVPLLFGLKMLYPWTNPAIVAADEVLQKKQGFLNEPFFIARAIIYFVVWISIVYFLNRWQRRRETADDVAKYELRLEYLSGWGLFFVGISFSLALVDWVMSLEPDWYSTMYAVALMTGSMLAAYAFSIGWTAFFVFRQPSAELISTKQLRGLGNLLLAFVMLWAYCSYSQFLLVWSANLRAEITWYIPRIQTSWGWIAAGLIVFHFFFPFFLLLSRDLKEKRKTLFGIALLIFILRYVDVFWLIKPAFVPTNLSANWLDFAATIGLGGVWLAAFLWLYKRESSPLAEISEYENEEEN